MAQRISASSRTSLTQPAPLPVGSPFPDVRTARRFAGPLPFTFDYEPETHSIVRIQGVRKQWDPIPVHVNVLQNSFLQREPFACRFAITCERIPNLRYRLRLETRRARGAEIMSTIAPPIRRARKFKGVLQILAFNWTFYALGTLLVSVLLALNWHFTIHPLLRLPLYLVVALTLFWMLSSLLASHYIYDLSRLYRWDWLCSLFEKPPAHWANIHAGLDQTTDALERLFPDPARKILDIYNASSMTEPSIKRARQRGNGAHQSRTGQNLLRCPLRDSECDAVFLIFAAHELRDRQDRQALFSEVSRSLRIEWPRHRDRTPARLGESACLWSRRVSLSFEKRVASFVAGNRSGNCQRDFDNTLCPLLHPDTHRTMSSTSLRSWPSVNRFAFIRIKFSPPIQSSLRSQCKAQGASTRYP